jgi:CDP-paratose 2-epimerase
MSAQKILITGGAGFIGCNAAQRYLQRGDRVVVVDNLSRRGTETNLAWLQAQGGELEFARCDIRDFTALSAVMAKHSDAKVVLHLAGQVAVTTSVTHPREDFEINALGTFNVLEAVRAHAKEAILLYSSTNKVYGGLESVGVTERDGKYQFDTRVHGIGEEQPVDFHSPYGCSKGAADQYVRDYARIYKMRTVCLRQSCIYGYRQFGIEDQGWVAWFTIAAELGKPITLYGDGKQIRDVLFVEDLCEAYFAAEANIERASGGIYNLGGGPANVMSLLELLGFLEKLSGKKIARTHADWRPGDQPVFVADIRKAERELHWRPKVSAEEGVTRLHAWVRENRNLF